MLLLLFLMFWHCSIPGAVAILGCFGIAVLFTCYYLLFPGVLALLYTWSCCCSWLSWHCCAVYLLLLPVVPGVLALLYTWSCCCSWMFWHCCAVYLLLPVVPGALALLNTWSLCFACLFWHCCAVYLLISCCSGIVEYLELLLFLVVLALPNASKMGLAFRIFFSKLPALCSKHLFEEAIRNFLFVLFDPCLPVRSLSRDS
jgi:hypothetical protein